MNDTTMFLVRFWTMGGKEPRMEVFTGIEKIMKVIDDSHRAGVKISVFTIECILDWS